MCTYMYVMHVFMGLCKHYFRYIIHVASAVVLNVSETKLRKENTYARTYCVITLSHFWKTFKTAMFYAHKYQASFEM